MRLRPNELRHISARRKLDPNLFVLPFGRVIMREPFAYFARLDPHRGVVAGIVAGWPGEHVYPYAAFLETLGLAVQRAFHHVSQEILGAPAGAKTLALEDSIERPANLGRIDLMIVMIV